MIKTIWKYNIFPGMNSIKIPDDSEFLSVKTQNGNPVMWFLVDPQSEKNFRRFEIHGTGHDIHYDMGVKRKFLGTFLIENDSLVFHVFERID